MRETNLIRYSTRILQLQVLVILLNFPTSEEIKENQNYLSTIYDLQALM